VFFAAIFATPFFGLLADKLGYRALMLMLGTLLLPLTFGSVQSLLWRREAGPEGHGLEAARAG
jgi:MFS family permease